MRAKKSLGQHFLRSEKALASIIRAAELQKGDLVLEIGPGTGILTEKLLATGCQVLAVEKDDELFEFLNDRFKKEIEAGQLTLIHGDILEFNLLSYNLAANSYKLISNIPYNITGAILEKFLSADPPAGGQPEKVVLLVQKEVAERIVGNRGSRASTKESILSISVKAYGKPRYIETVKAGSFAPAPQVDSAILAIEDISKDFFTCGHRVSTRGGGFSEDEFFRTLKTGFRSKRKKLSSNLGTIFDKERVRVAFQKLELDDNARAEDLGPKTWKGLAEVLLG